MSADRLMPELVDKAGRPLRVGSLVWEGDNVVGHGRVDAIHWREFGGWVVSVRPRETDAILAVHFSTAPGRGWGTFRCAELELEEVPGA